MARSANQSGEQSASVRETVESIWIAVVLAFVLRAFVLEAFVIPTGSMAPRLMGQHWQFDCPACGYHYAFGIPHEHGSPPLNLSAPLTPSGRPPGSRLNRGGGTMPICPNCGYRHRFNVEYAYGGDRVLVLKYLYRFTEPKPWEVVVFKNPQDNEQNYIKRLIGLPGQMIEIVHGNVFVCDGKDLNNDGVIDKSDFDVNGDGKADSDDLSDPRFARNYKPRILRKSPKTQDVMWQVIFDNDYQSDQAVWRAGNGKEWESPWQPPPGPNVWEKSHGGRVFKFNGSKDSKASSELRFAADTEVKADRRRFCPVYAYNQSNQRYNSEVDVCSDLKLSFMFVPKESSGVRVGLRLSSFSDHFRARIDMNGSCTLEHGVTDGEDVKWDKEPWDSVRIDPLVMDRACNIALTNVERQVTLWVNGKAVLTSTDAQYSADRVRIIREVKNALKKHPDGVPVPTVAILAEGGPAELWHVKLMRDVYYTCPDITLPGTPLDERRRGRATTGNPMVLRKFAKKPDLDEFFVLGDNSPASLDSRLWKHGAPTLRKGYRKGTVPRYNMIGRAFFVYWPGGFRLPMLERLPIVPNVGRMRLIR